MQIGHFKRVISKHANTTLENLDVFLCLCFQDTNSRILATGGASKNLAILQVLSDIFLAPVYTIPGTANSACLGCAYRAKHGWSGTSSVDYNEIFSGNEEYELAVTPSLETKDLYEKMARRYKRLEQRIAK